MTDINNNYKIPCVIGVTGHRDLIPEQVNDIKRHIKETIEDQLDKYPNTPVVVLSPLAEGGDTVVAEAVIELKNSANYKDRIQLFAPLPLKEDLYKQDFNGKALDEFENLLKQADKVYELDAHLNWENADELKLSLKTDLNYSDERNAQYVQVGAYVAKHSNILIAIWDGIPLTDPGGTAQIVEYIRGNPINMGEKLPDYLSQTSGVGCTSPKLLKHIKVGRTRDKSKDIEVSLENDADQSADNKQKIKFLLSEIEDHNIQVNYLISKEKLTDKNIEASKEHFYQFDGNEFIKPVRNLFSFFDAAAIRQQKKHKKGQFINVIIALFIAFLTKIFSDISDNETTTAIILFVIFLLTFTLLANNTFIGIKNYKNRFIRNRLCSEIVRLEVALMIFGIKNSVSKMSCFATPILSHVVSWCRVQVDASQNNRPSNNIEKVQEYWIKDQIIYTNGNEIKAKKKKAKFSRIGYVSCIWFSVILLITNSLIGINIIDNSTVPVNTYSAYISLIIVVFLVISAFFNRWNNIYEYKKDVEQNNSLKKLYVMAEKQLSNNKNNVQVIEQTILELYSLISNIQIRWSINHQATSINELGPFSSVSHVASLLLSISLISLISAMWSLNYQLYLYFVFIFSFLTSVYLFIKHTNLVEYIKEKITKQ
jgi:hypothetical protein